MSKRTDYQVKMEKQLTVWSTQLDSLRTKAGNQVEAKYHKAMTEWKVAQTRLKELKAAGRDRWDIIRVDAEKAWHAVESALGRPPAEPPVPETTASTRITDRGMAVVIPEGEPPAPM